MGLPASHRVTRAPWYSGTSSSEPAAIRIRGCHPLWPALPDRSARLLVCNSPTRPYPCQMMAFNPPPPTHTGLAETGFGLFPFRSPLLWESRLLSLPAGTEMFHFPAWASRGLWIQLRERRQTSPGFPHSGIPGSRPACGSPRLIAACYALHRLLMPRHPPYTLSNLTSFTSDTHDLRSVYSVVKEQRSRQYPKAFVPTYKTKLFVSNTMVELIGIEPTTSGLQSPRSPS